MTSEDEEKPQKTFQCGFCKKLSNEVVDMIVGGDETHAICNECVVTATEAMEESRKEMAINAREDAKAKSSVPNPRKIVKGLDEYIISQHHAKKVLAVAVREHYKRLLGESGDNKGFDKSNILLIGPTGTGKTLFAQTLAKIIDVPFAFADATTLTEAGYMGEDVEGILQKLLVAAGNDIKRAEMGIVYIDEIDKITSGDKEGYHNVTKEGVQQALLKLLEGTAVNTPTRAGNRRHNQEYASIDTSNILFICGGAFRGLDKIIEKRNQKKDASIGFGATLAEEDADKPVDLLEKVNSADLRDFGLIPEFLGRLPVVATLRDLSTKDLETILTEPKNAIVKQYKNSFKMDGIELEVSENAITEIAKKAVENKTGARGLRAIMESLLLPILYEIPETSVKSVTINADAVKGKKEAKIIYFNDGINSEDFPHEGKDQGQPELFSA